MVSCDNTAGNGAALARVVREFVEASAWSDRDPVLDWLGDVGRLPGHDRRPDRPGHDAADRDSAEAALGVRDEMAVVGEPYRQWVLQDAFVAARPAGRSTARSSSRTSRPTS